MNRYSTNEAAKLLRTTGTSLVRYMKSGKIPTPEVIKAGRSTVHSWSDKDIEHVRQLLPKIANGRKTRYSKLGEKQKAPAKSPVPRKSVKPKNQEAKG